MKTFLSKLAAAATIVSLLLFALTVTLWIRSYHVRDGLNWSNRYRANDLMTVKGRVAYSWRGGNVVRPVEKIKYVQLKPIEGASGRFQQPNNSRRMINANFDGFGITLWRWEEKTDSLFPDLYTSGYIAIHLAWGLLFALPPVLWVIRRTRRQRNTVGFPMTVC